MPGKGRTFRRHTAVFWDIWPMPPKIDTRNDILFVDGIYLSKKAWRTAKLQKCIFHAVCQVKRYTTTRPKTLAGIMLYALGNELLHITNQEEAQAWVQRLFSWRITFRSFLSEMTRDSNGNLRSTHERLLKAYNSLVVLIKANTLFTYSDDTLQLEIACPSTNNAIEGGVNAQLRSLLRNHRGMSIERRIKAVFWWCYLHSPRPLSAKEILKTMPTDKSIAKIYKSMNDRAQLEGSIPTWGDAIVWSDLHNSNTAYPPFLLPVWGSNTHSIAQKQAHHSKKMRAFYVLDAFNKTQHFRYPKKD